MFDFFQRRGGMGRNAREPEEAAGVFLRQLVHVGVVRVAVDRASGLAAHDHAVGDSGLGHFPDQEVEEVYKRQR